AAGAALGLRELLDHFELHLNDRYDHELRNALARLDRERRLATVPARDEHLALVVGVDQPDQIAEHDAVLVPEAGARQHDRRITGVFQMDRDARGDELRVARLQLERRVDAGAQVDTCGALSRVLRQRVFAANAWVEDAHLEPVTRAGGVRSISWHEQDSSILWRMSGSCCWPDSARR